MVNLIVETPRSTINSSITITVGIEVTTTNRLNGYKDCLAYFGTPRPFAIG
jgi:hypothetical protein